MGGSAMQEAVTEHTLEHTKQRMFDLMITPGISCRMLFQFAPVAVRRMFMSKRDITCNPIQVQHGRPPP